MTPEVLVHQLSTELKKMLKDIIFYDEEGKKTEIHVYEQTLPRKVSDSDTTPFPYCVVKFVKSAVTDVGERQPVDIVLSFGSCYFDSDCQYQHSYHTAFERIKKRFIEQNFLGPFRCEPEMEFVFSEEDDETYPYYFAGAAMKWMAPGYERMDEYS